MVVLKVSRPKVSGKSGSTLGDETFVEILQSAEPGPWEGKGGLLASRHVVMKVSDSQLTFGHGSGQRLETKR